MTACGCSSSAELPAGITTATFAVPRLLNTPAPSATRLADELGPPRPLLQMKACRQKRGRRSRIDHAGFEIKIEVAIDRRGLRGGAEIVDNDVAVGSPASGEKCSNGHAVGN